MVTINTITKAKENFSAGNRNNIVLIGMPGAGKSTVGTHLAKALKMDFTDTDLIIRQAENKELRDIVNEIGLIGFLRIQEEHILKLHVSNCIIATGGSVVYSPNVMAHLKEAGRVVYLKLGIDELLERIGPDRRLARDSGKSFYDLYNERVPLYERYADIIIDCSNKSVEEVTREIIRSLS